MISVRVFYNGRAADGIPVQTDVDNEKIYTDEKGTAMFPDVDTGTRTIYVRGKKVVDRVYKEDGVYLVALDFNPW